MLSNILQKYYYQISSGLVVIFDFLLSLNIPRLAESWLSFFYPKIVKRKTTSIAILDFQSFLYLSFANLNFQLIKSTKD